ncbi:hypothetical protein I3760_02G100400 [Carya illinoinensis]|nr:hypothetical protein I3760_02G100400 [Carya illinoinensis]KAG2721852.1 hypothetical protein I3760_02G100400 [Carya illinoinensis]KAG2721853.1 hypothetical protein I3760_02G100400 [Carya illinoinensis]KAG2721854.1 hypothetical protein I3760_02G100400 [Carya illinoinensis]
MTSCTCLIFRMNRKPAWYQRAVKMATVWRSTISKSREIPTKNATILWRSTISRATSEIDHPTHASSKLYTRNNKLSKCSSLKIATTTFTRVCLCAPISSYKELNFRAEQIPPRRSNSYPRYSKSSTTFPTSQDGVNYNIPTPRLSVEGGRRVFRGKSLTDDVLMRRFVVEEEAMMQVRRRNQMEAIRRRSIMRRKKLGPSRLSRMVMAGEEHA